MPIRASAILGVMLLLAVTLTATGTPAPEQDIAIEVAGNGFAALSLENPDSLEARIYFQYWTENGFAPFVIGFVHENGTKFYVTENARDMDDEISGDTYAYVRVDEYAVGPTDELRPIRREVDYEFVRTFPSNVGTLLIMWANIDEPFTLHIELNAGSLVRALATGVTESFQTKDLGRGVGVGVPTALRVHAGSVSERATEGGREVLFLAFKRQGYAGLGRLRIEADAEAREISYDNIPTPDDECFCFDYGLALAHGTERVGVSFDYVGWGRVADVAGMHFTLPHEFPLPLPNPIWHIEWDPFKDPDPVSNP